MSTPESEASLSIKDKVAVVTGGGTGIGRAIALEFAKAGADVIVAGRRLAPLEEVAEEIKALGRRALPISVDMSKRSEVNGLVEKVESEFGAIDILVNNAAHSGHARGLDHDPSSILDEECDEELWDQIIDVNLKSVYLSCRAIAPRMVERNRGNIINISSIDGIRTPRKSNTYAISKAGVIMLTKGLAWDLGPHSIRVNSIAPGPIQTDMIRRIWEDPEVLKGIEPQILLRRIGQPTDIGTVALFLASDASNYITGQVIVADGGVLA